ncbi:cyclase family protein [Stigmatella aurantiaca]|uniref:Cyclase family protein n=2 Tax=Stigmatella aurantiaca (strain DW4/3-1) TaxID=378806 RepID=E3FVX2_STIAD|nr:cyclase family protein [Stigmatella aurantiaca]ADO73512.1 cyclase family protein [Stigmatella aurantiaca DW4/3-1]
MNDPWRAQFDAEVTFQNGGGLQAHEFRLDIPGTDISDEALGALFVRELGLLMVESVRITHKRLLREPHKGTSAASRPESPPPTRQWVELSHVVHHGMVTYPGLPAPELTDHMTREDSRARYAEGATFHIGRISMVSNTGTYLDTPFHRFDGRPDLAALPLSSVADLEGLVIRVQDSRSRSVDLNLLLPFDVRGRAVLLHTGWDRHWGTAQYGVDAPFLTRDAAAWLAEQGAALVGIDSVNIDDMGDKSRPAHTLLLAASIPIVEHLRGLEQLPPQGFRFSAPPVRVQGMGTFPVRAYAVISG